MQPRHVSVSTSDGSFLLSVPYSPENVERCRQLPDRRWDPESKRWVVPSSVAVALTISELFSGQRLSGDSRFSELLREGQEEERRWNATKEETPEEIPSTKTAPWEHQRRAFWLAHDKPATMLAMGMGSGKSKVVCDLVGNERPRRVLILCPKSVIPVWPSQFSQHCSDEDIAVIALHKGTSQHKKERAALYFSRGLRGVLVLNYESAWLGELGEWLLEQSWDIVVLDESHKIKAPNGRASKFCEKLSRSAKKRVCLTGTPMPHSPLDIFGQFRFLDPSVFGTSFQRFKMRYAIMGGFTNPAGRPVQVVGFQNQGELAHKMSGLTFQVKTDDVIDLPDQTHTVRYHHLTAKEAKCYRELNKDLITELERGEVTADNALIKLLRLAQVTGGFLPVEVEKHGEMVKEIVDLNGEQAGSKMRLCADVLEDIALDQPVVICCRFRTDMDMAHEVARLVGRPSVEISGRVNGLKRDGRRADKWEPLNALHHHSEPKPGAEVLVVQIQAGGVGLDFTASHFCILYSVGYSRGDYDQFLARQRRPGQKHHCTYVHLVGQDTVNERVYLALDSKKKIVEFVLEKLT